VSDVTQLPIGADSSAIAAGPAEVRDTYVVSFDDIYQKEYAGLVRLAFVLTGRLDVAEELVQDLNGRLDRRWRTADVFPMMLGPDEYYLAGDNRETPNVALFVVVKRSEILAQAERGCSAFMNLDATAQQIATVRSVFETELAIKSFRYVDKSEALEEIKRLFPGSPEMTDLLASDGQGVPASFRAVMNREIDSGGFEARTKLQAGVSILRCGLPIVEAQYEPLTERPTPTEVDGAFVTAAPATTTAPSSETTTTG
jgi:FtsX extracellular domain